jgi:glycerol-3-phosphate acyltransferase PlsX
MRIGIDAMGGDYAPDEILKGALSASEMYPELEIVLFGESDNLYKGYSKSDFSSANIEVVETGDTIGMSEHPTRAIAQKKESSINVGLAALGQGSIDAFVGAGNTGAMLVGAMYSVGVIEGVQRPAICSLVPKTDGTKGLLLDVGANADCKPEFLYQFGVLGSRLVENVYGLDNPKVGLLSIGEEKEKGNIVTQAAHQLLAESNSINFIGNIEGRDIFGSKADVMVCDGFTGNVVLKACEGFGYQLLKRGVRDEFLGRFDFRQYGGTPILGVNKPVIIGHGISKSETIVKMVKLGADIVKSNLIEKIKTSL